MKKDILIVGGGIAGVTCAGELAKSDKYNITLIEKGTSWRTIGYAVGLWKGSLGILKRLGIYIKLQTANTLHPSYGLVLQDIHKTIFFDMSEAFSIQKPISYLVRREDLHKLLIEKLSKKVTVRFKTTLLSIKQQQTKMRVTFSDGNTEKYDMVIGADGIYSQVRDLTFGDSSKEPYGWRAWYFWTQTRPKLPNRYEGTMNIGEILIRVPCFGKIGNIFMEYSRGNSHTISDTIPFEKLKNMGLRKKLLSQMNQIRILAVLPCIKVSHLNGIKIPLH